MSWSSVWSWADPSMTPQSYQCNSIEQSHPFLTPVLPRFNPGFIKLTKIKDFWGIFDLSLTTEWPRVDQKLTLTSPLPHPILIPFSLHFHPGFNNLPKIYEIWPLIDLGTPGLNGFKMVLKGKNDDIQFLWHFVCYTFM